MITYKPREYEIPPEGMYRARLEEITDAAPGINPRGEETQRVRFNWTLLNQFTSAGDAMRVFQTFNSTLAPRSFLFAAVTDIRGVPPGNEFDLDSLIGTECDLVLRHHITDDGRKFCNVKTILRLPTPAEAAEEKRVAAATTAVKQAAQRPHVVSRPAPPAPPAEIDDSDVPF
jgi:hypothetical protein